ncbi:MAG: DUF2236 domain-containing protein [Actinobacteria bacterium]|nr:DUF2236 domain-containing protein [Actinomycetota bacterium]
MGDKAVLTAAEVDGFFPADSMVRRLHAERVVLFSGVRALLMQACEPLGVIGFERHSIIFDDPRLRLRRTDERMSRIYFGTVEQAEETGRVVCAMHEHVRGVTGEDYASPAPSSRSRPALLRSLLVPTCATNSERRSRRGGYPFGRPVQLAHALRRRSRRLHPVDRPCALAPVL